MFVFSRDHIPPTIMATIYYSALIALLSISHLVVSASAEPTAAVQVLYAPTSIALKPTEASLKSSDYSKFVSLCLGLSTDNPTDWNGFAKYNSFSNIPKNVVTFVSSASAAKHSSLDFALEEDKDISTQYTTIANIFTTRFAKSYSKKFEHIESGKELAAINKELATLDKLKTDALLPQNVNLWFDLAKFNPTNLPKIVDQLRSVFDDRVLIAWVYQEEATEGIIRRARAAEANEDPKTYNMAYEFDADFHTGFVMIGFTTVVLLVTVLVVSVGMWNINPGRDSIIYRLTAQKMKKEQ